MFTILQTFVVYFRNMLIFVSDNQLCMQSSHETTVVAAFIFTKKELCAHLGLITPDGRVEYNRLRRILFTAKFLEKMGLTEAEYKKIRTFNLEQSKIIAQELKND